MLPRNPTLLEKMLLALGGTLVLLDLPMEFLTLYIDMPWINLFNDIKQVEFCEIMSFEESKSNCSHLQIFPIDLDFLKSLPTLCNSFFYYFYNNISSVVEF